MYFLRLLIYTAKGLYLCLLEPVDCPTGTRVRGRGRRRVACGQRLEIRPI